jgi:hypothetical protein
MADQPENTPPTETVASNASPASGAVSPSQPQPSDSRLAAILAKKASGETLTAADRGYLGSVKRKAKAKAPAAPVAENPLFEARPAVAATAPAAAAMAKPADNPLFVETEIPASVSPVANFDSALLRSTANALLDSVDTATKLYIGHEARSAGADQTTAEQYKSAVALQPENRQLMVENSEPVILSLCEVFKTTPDKLSTTLKNCGFFGGLVAHSLGVFAVAKSIRESRQQFQQQQQPQPAQAA